MTTDNINTSEPLIEIVYYDRQDLSTGHYCVRENSVKYGIIDETKVNTSIKEVNGKKFIEIDLSAKIQKQLDNAANAKEQRKIMYDYILEYLRGEYRALDGRNIAINKGSADKITHRASIVKLRVAPHLGELIKIGQFIGLVDVTHKKFKQFAYYDVFFKVYDKWYLGRLNIGVRENEESVLHELNKLEEINIEEAGSPIWAPKIQAKETLQQRLNDPASSDTYNITEFPEKVN
jgi:hypothetical protein